MKRTIGLAFIVFTGALGVVIGYKLSSEALAVIAGVVVGVLAVIPMAVLMLVVVRKSMANRQPAYPQSPAQQPTVIVVGGQPAQLSGPQQDPWSVDGQWRPAEAQPAFRMLGEDPQ